MLRNIAKTISNVTEFSSAGNGFLWQFSRSLSAQAAAQNMKEMKEDGVGIASIGEVLVEKRLRTGETGAWLHVVKDDTVFAAIQKMAQANVGSLLVVDQYTGEDYHEVENVVGIISERDYLKRIALQGRNSKNTKVSDIMTSKDKMLTVNPKDTVLQAMAIMTKANIRHLPVVSLDGRSMAGMLSIKDVVERVVQDQSDRLHELSAYVSGTSY